MENNSMALLILFNHRYDKNINVLKNMYKNRFSNIFFIVPFYEGDDENVIPVYGRSIFFQSYLAQAYNVLSRQKMYEHYLVIADDMIIHPQLNESNYKDFFEVEEGQSFIPYLKTLDSLSYFWIGSLSAFTYRKKQKYVEIATELPTQEEALRKMEIQDVQITPLSRKNIFHEFTFNISSLANKARLALRILTLLKHPFKKKYQLDFPMVCSYSDIILIAGDTMKDFAHYCGILGATSLFVEVAIPTALVMATRKKIVTEEHTKRKGRSFWASKDNVFCESDSYTFANLEKQYKNLEDMMNRFPDECIYIHPVKLSKWINK